MNDQPGTESRNPRAAGLGTATTREILELMNDEDATVAAAVRRSLPEIARAVDAIVSGIAEGGHVHYVGAGTSGRLGVLDASEAPPTFGVAAELFHGIIAGGDGALRSAVEGAEDSSDAGRADIEVALRSHDIVVGISASGRAPYVLGALDAARERSLATIGITCVAESPLARAAAVPIVVDVGPEVIAGSSRLKAGTATKLVLNMLSTAAMIRSGHTKGDLMIDVRATNEKLRARAIGIVRDELGVDESDARARLEACGWSVRRAIAPR